MSCCCTTLLLLQGESWSLVSRDASDKITAVVTRMLSYLHSTTTDLGLPDDFKLQDFELAAATLSADTVEAVSGRVSLEVLVLLQGHRQLLTVLQCLIRASCV